MPRTMSRFLRQMRKFEYSDILGWSFSRYSTFQQCKRKYFYEYYGKRDIANAPKIARLRRLTTVPLEIGNISHKVIRRLLQRLQKVEEPINLEQFFQYVERATREIVKTKEFEDVYYQKREEIDSDVEILPEIAISMENFLKSDRMQWLFEEAIATKKDWIVELPDEFKYGECRIDELKAYCKVDFMFPIGDGVHILEWKTGKEDYAKHGMQLRGYAGWANFQLGLDFEKITTTIAYLRPEYKEHTVILNDYDIADLAETVRNQTDAMYEYCEIPELNMPKAKEDFPMTQFEGFCKTCKYRELCDRN